MIPEEWVTRIIYEEGEKLSFDKVKDKAFLFLTYIQRTDADLFDYWFRIADNWDLNIWIEDDNPLLDTVPDEEIVNMTLYPLKQDGTSDYCSFYRIMTNGKPIAIDKIRKE